MDERVAELTRELKRRPPADEAAIEACERQLGFRFPADYREFLLEANGGEGFVAELAYLMLWPVEELPEDNEDYEVEEMAPGLVLFGSSGGGTFFAFEREGGGIVDLPSMPVAGEDAKPAGATFAEFLERLAATD